jgi:hypothetical protein
MKKKLMFSYLFFMMLLLFGCKKFKSKNSSEVTQNSIFQFYRLEYDAEENKSYLKAFFQEDSDQGVYLKLDGNSSVYANNQIMNNSGTDYYNTYNGFLDSINLIYTNNDGEQYANTIYSEDYIANDNTNLISKSLNSTWLFDGVQINTGETIDLKIQMKNDLAKIANVSSSIQGATFLNLTVSNLQKLIPGIAQVSTSRTSYDYTGNWTNSGGTKKSKYTSVINDVNVIE